MFGKVYELFIVSALCSTNNITKIYLFHGKNLWVEQHVILLA